MNAYVQTLKNDVRVFVSYYTPIALIIKNKIITSDKKYSSTTSRQKNRFIKEYALKVNTISHENFLKLLKKYNIYKGWA
jgi:hypothetical protein